MDTSQLAREPLAVLLSWAWIAHVIEVDNRVEDAGREKVGRLFNISLPMWANGLRLIEKNGTSVGELRRRAGAACNLGGLERWGWIAIGDGTSRRDGYGTSRGVKADTVLRPTRAGAYAKRLFPEAIEQVEQAWRDRFGGDRIDALSDRLAAQPHTLAWSPPEVHPSDGFFTHAAGDLEPRPSRHLVALLGQTLAARTVEAERNAPVSLPLAANLLRTLATSPAAIKDLPARTGLSKEAIAMSVRFLLRHRLGAAGAERTVELTAAGLSALRAYHERAMTDRDPELRTALEALLDETAALSAGLAPPDHGWRNRKPYLSQTRRVLTDPPGALPRQPMVLHRGGWPDGR